MLRHPHLRAALSGLTLVAYFAGSVRPAFAIGSAGEEVIPTADPAPPPAAPSPASGAGIESSETRPQPGDGRAGAGEAEKAASEPEAAAAGKPAAESLQATTAAAKSAEEVPSQAISIPKGEGTIEGLGESFSTNLPTGTFEYTIPLRTPTARGGAQPSMALAYNSGSGAGSAGIGWDLPVPFIARETSRGTPRYNEPADGSFVVDQDRFVFNGGQQLVPICVVASGGCAAAPGETMPPWASGWTYFRPRVESAFQRFFWSSDRRTWRVLSKTGASMELGVPLDGSGDTSALERDPASPTHVFRWNAARAYDAYDTAGANTASAATPSPANVVLYRYATVEGGTYLVDVYDTPPAASPATKDVTLFAHHVHLGYEERTDPTFSFVRGWQSALTRRLTHVDVTSKGDTASSARTLVRRYWLRYESGLRTTHLHQLQTEGRCPADVPESSAGLLPDTTGCPALPPATFGYSSARDGDPSATAFANLGPLSSKVLTVANAPSRSLSDSDIDVIDVDGDALPDILRTSPSSTAPQHGVFFNGAGAQSASLGAVTSITMGAGSPYDSSQVAFGKPNVVSMDEDADARVDLLYIPTGPNSRVYSATNATGSWTWASRALQTPTDSGTYLDLTGRRPNTRVLDVNNDGLVDLVVAESTRIKTYFALGRYPGGDGRLGSAKWTSPTTATLSTEPVVNCLPGDTSGAQFGQAGVMVADMNGDGIPDIVRVQTNRVEYWPGRGDGSWGIVPPLACAPNRAPGATASVLMTSAPPVAPSTVEFIHLGDIDHDGLDDIVDTRGQTIDVYFNLGGTAFAAAPLHIHDTRIPAATTNVARLVDMNGSGATDVLWGHQAGFVYVDFLGGVRPHLLSSIANGLGKTVSIGYGSSAAAMLDAARAGTPWATKMPIITTLVRKVVVTDNLPLAGRPAGTYETDYTYLDPDFEGWERQFRGFREVRARSLGDTNSPPSTTRTVHLSGDCVDETPSDGVPDCTPPARWRDNGREALKGLPSLVEQFDDKGVYGATTHRTYTLRHLYSGLDGRSVRHAFESSADMWKHDTYAFAPSSATQSTPDVLLEGVGGPGVSSAVPVRSATGRAHLQTSSTFDRFGNALTQVSAGCVDGCMALDGVTPRADEVISHVSQPGIVPGDASGWIFRSLHAWVVGSENPTQPRGRQDFTYDAHGALVATRAVLVGTQPLQRFHEIAAQAVAPTPRAASADGTVLLSAEDHDAFGNVTFRRSANNRCQQLALDPAYASLLATTTEYVGAVGPDVGKGSAASAAFASTPSGSGCGAIAMTTSAAFDRGLGNPLRLTGPHGETTTARYDGLGRVIETHRPDPASAGAASTLASTLIDYDLDPTGARAYSLVHLRTQDGAAAAAASYRETWSYIDGLGRTVLRLEQADPAAGDLGAWTVRGLTDYDHKGAPQRVFLPWFRDVTPNAYPLSAATTTLFTSHTYDAFGREVDTLDTTGAVSLERRYHAVSVDLWDGGDLRSTDHQGTYASVRQDGHGRAIVETERARVNGTLESHETRTAYLPTGEPASITRARVGAPDAPVVRWMAYDTLGRMTVNADPDASSAFNAIPASATATKAWRYAYDDAGDVVATSDARGCGENLHYDAGGRLIAEDYSPCLALHAAYSAPDLVAGAGAEVFHRYDSYDPSDTATTAAAIAPQWALGRATTSIDRGSRTVFGYDARGRQTSEMRQIARPQIGPTELGAPFAPRRYIRRVGYDAADRATTEQVLVAEPTDGPSTNEESSLVTTAFSKRGAVASVTSRQGSLITRVTHDPDGLTRDIVYGDAAGTTTSFTYDTKRRLQTAQTYRAAPNSLWRATPAAYVPPPDPTGAPSSFQLDLEDLTFTYDEVDNPLVIQDVRNAAEWPVGAKPVTRRMKYDDLNRLARIDYQYVPGDDAWVSPFAAEDQRGSRGNGAPAPHVRFDARVKWQTFQYDWLGNTALTADDVGGFYDRSLGTIANGSAAAGPYQLRSATLPSIGSPARGGRLAATYDAAGNLLVLQVGRDGPCLPAGSLCGQRFAYDWDEVGRLVRGRRWDAADAFALPSASAVPAIELHYRYDGDDTRTVKVALDPNGVAASTIYPFAEYELRQAAYGGAAGDYERSTSTERKYLFAQGVRLARVVQGESDVPSLASGTVHTFLELLDHLGSTGIVIDRDTSELVERSTYQAYGATESDYRPARWDSFREDYRFTGKEEDVEVGLQYFGRRYYAPTLDRWVSADPLAVHSPGSADLNAYAYVHGRVLSAVDPVGLQETVPLQAPTPTAPPVSAPGTPGSDVRIWDPEYLWSPKGFPGPEAPVTAVEAPSAVGQGAAVVAESSVVGMGLAVGVMLCVAAICMETYPVDPPLDPGMQSYKAPDEPTPLLPEKPYSDNKSADDGHQPQTPPPETDALKAPKGSANPATRAASSRGSTLHSDRPGHLPEQLRSRYPDTIFDFTKSGKAGQDARVVGGKHPSAYPNSTWPAGVDYGDFKPGTPTGARTFISDQKHKWSAPTYMLPYDPKTGTLK